MINETAEQKEIRMFNFYKKDLEKLGKEHGQIRMICIEYVCSFPKINPFKIHQHHIKLSKPPVWR